MKTLSEAEMKEIKKKYPIGCRVELIHMNDFYAPPKGTQGIVRYIDCIGTIHVNWDNGSTLGVLYEEDKCKRIM